MSHSGISSPDELLLTYAVHKVFRILPAVTLTFDLLTPKSNWHVYEPNYIFWPKLAKIPFTSFGDMVLTRFSGCTDSQNHSRLETSENKIPPTLKA